MDGTPNFNQMFGPIIVTMDDNRMHFKMPVPKGVAPKMLCGQPYEVGKAYFITDQKADVTCPACNEWLHA